MTTLPIILLPDPVLKQVAQPIENITEEIRDLAANMAETMYAAPGIGLAANQVNVLKRIFVMDTDFREDKTSRNFVTMINPEIVWKSEEMSVMEEGCLSIPQQYADVERPKAVRVKFVDLEGEMKEILAEDLMSHCVQHELDHLNGTLFIDYLSRLKRNMLLKRYDKAQKEKEIL
ncbi:MAG: peptide deformylase [Micavibrio aeruginosavorus]|uniref:Peptide deformylase n=1 Tax=Micavibrio aeruginosavorus TaxID=349221 RepID=A0A2W5FHR0_9BACT|nr:MAG: peptide deformylase [Micavibrio aeruginosavorus]